MSATHRGEAAPAAGEAFLVRRAAGGDRAAFEALYRQHAPRVYALCLRLSGDPGEADELTQLAFIRAWEKLDGFRGDSAFGTWLHRLATNVVLGVWRSRKRIAWIESTGDPAAWERPAHAPHAGVKIDLESAIAALPDGARAVFVLHEIEGHGHAGIAAMLGIAEGTCKAHLHRARRLLRERLSA